MTIKSLAKKLTASYEPRLLKTMVRNFLGMHGYRFASVGNFWAMRERLRLEAQEELWQKEQDAKTEALMTAAERESARKRDEDFARPVKIDWAASGLKDPDEV